VQTTESNGTNVGLNDQPGQVCTLNPLSFVVTLPNIFGGPGSQVCMDVTVGNFIQLTNLQFSMNWNPAIIEYDTVLSTGNAPFFLSPEDTEITISRDGTVATNNGELGKVRLVSFDEPQKLKRFADGLFASDQAPKDVETPEIAQGTLEGANIKPIFEMANLIEISRKYDDIRKFIDQEDKRMRNMIREFGQTV